MRVRVLQLPGDGLSAAALCLTAPLPVADPVETRAVVRRCAAFAAELRECERIVSHQGASAEWSGTAADAFRQRLGACAPDIVASAERYSAYAVALSSYAGALDYAVVLPELASRLQLELTQTQNAIVAAAQLSYPSLQAAVPSVPPALQASTSGAETAARHASAQRQQDELLLSARRFAGEYNSWATAVHSCASLIRSADAHDPGHDPHGWTLLRHRLESVASHAGSAVSATVRQIGAAVATYVEHPSWRNLSNALSAVSSGLTFIALVLFPLVPWVSLICFAVVTVLSACALAVDSWRKWGEHEQVSIGTIAFDAVGAVPVGGVVRGGRLISTAGARGWRTSAETTRLRAFATGAAPVLRDGVRRSTRQPLLLWDPDYESLTGAHFRSLQHGGWNGLGRRWSGPLLWDATNAAAGLPANGSGSTPQYLWNHRKTIERAAPRPIELPVRRLVNAAR